MLHLTESVLTLEFIEKLKGGLLLIFNEKEGTTHLGWIEKAALQEKEIEFELGLTVVQNWRKSGRWDLLDSHVFKVVDVDHFTALDNYGGYLCTDTHLSQPTFRVYPASSIPAEYARTHKQLIEYGDMMR